MLKPSFFGKSGYLRSCLAALASWLQQWAQVGVSSVSDPVDQLKVVQVNVCAMMAIAAVVMFNLLFVISGSWGLILSGLVQWPFALLIAMTFELNAKGQYQQARVFMIAMVLALLVAIIVFAQGTSMSVHYYFLLVTVMMVPLFRLSDWFWSAVFIAISLLLFVFFESRGWPAHPSIMGEAAHWVQGLRISVISSCVAMAMAVVVISEASSERYIHSLASLAMTDALTGLPNRRAGSEKLSSEMAQSRRSIRPLAVAMVDIDFFKRVNDEEGHEVGDLALCHVADLLRRHLRAGDVVARMGGEEFAVVMPYTHLSEAHAALDAVRHVIANAPFHWALTRNKPKGGRVLTVSIGVAVMQPEWSADQFLLCADTALYEAKARGRNRVLSYAASI